MSEKKKERSPSQLGNLIFEGQKAAQFWIRVFDLEAEVATVQELLTVKPERKRAAMPIVAEYEIDERFKFIFVIHLEVDALGIQDGLGIIYWTSPEHEEEVYRSRDKHAESLLKKLEMSAMFHEVIEMEKKGKEE